jgi:hypothetical protein
MFVVQKKKELLEMYGLMPENIGSQSVRKCAPTHWHVSSESVSGSLLKKDVLHVIRCL